MIAKIATPSDFRQFFKIDAPDIFTALCLKDGHVVTGIGGIVYDGNYEGWAFVDGGPRTPMLHRYAVRFLDAMRKVGEPIIRTVCDDNDTARRWLERLGFRKTNEMINDVPIWEWKSWPH